MDLGFGNSNQQVGTHAAMMVEKIVGMQESMLDEELSRMDNADEIAKIRSRRLLELKKRKEEESTWSRNGHGSLTTLTDTKEFFEAAKKSKRLVVHFQRPTSHHCVALDGHLAKLASLHRETKFSKMDAEKTPYLCEQLLADPEGNVVIPTVLLVLEGKVVYHVRGLQEIGGEQLNTDLLAAVLQIHGLIEEQEQQNGGPPPPVAVTLEEARANAIRSGFYDDVEDDYETGELDNA